MLLCVRVVYLVALCDVMGVVDWCYGLREMTLLCYVCRWWC